ncbi:MAG: branched-chain amino acid ABC transporter substrate-binding protein [Deltaproteobacteria bacterium]|jgi:branched-chain amino acid transport system substrate-binding protein|nr:branched-chain amino acid ABC transporter substrate-binding protein [Deltaproteobacteria bacterium]
MTCSSPRRIVSAFASVLALLAFSAFFLINQGSLALAKEEGKFRLGFGGALLGNLASYGLSNRYGLEYAVIDQNKKGGLLGSQIEIVAQDDSCNPAQAAAAATKLLSSGVKFVMGHTCSGATRSALSAYGNNALVISSSATDNNLTDSGQHPYFFRTTPRDDIQTKIQIALIRKKNYKKIAILHDKGDYGQALAESIRQLAQADPGREVVVFEGINSGQVSFDAIISKIKETQAEVLVWGGYYNDAAKLVTQARRKNVNVPLIGPDGLYDPRFIVLAADAAEGTYCTGQVDHSQSALAMEAIKDHRSRYYTQDIGTYFFYAAGAAQSLFAALETVGQKAIDQTLAERKAAAEKAAKEKTPNQPPAAPVEPPRIEEVNLDFKAVKQFLNEKVVETVMGPVRYDAKGDIIGEGYKLFQIQNGKFVEVPMSNHLNL